MGGASHRRKCKGNRVFQTSCDRRRRYSRGYCQTNYTRETKGQTCGRIGVIWGTNTSQIFLQRRVYSEHTKRGSLPSQGNNDTKQRCYQVEGSLVQRACYSGNCTYHYQHGRVEAHVTRQRLYSSGNGDQNCTQRVMQDKHKRAG